VLLDGYFSEKPMRMGGGGSKLCSLLSLILYPKHVHFTSLMLAAEYWGSGAVGHVAVCLAPCVGLKLVCGGTQSVGYRHAGAKMLMLEEVVTKQLEAEGHVLMDKAAEHMLTCFRSRDPNISLELVVHGPDVEAEEAARGIV
jgi:hypothetical protein